MFNEVLPSCLLAGSPARLVRRLPEVLAVVVVFLLMLLLLLPPLPLLRIPLSGIFCHASQDKSSADKLFL